MRKEIRPDIDFAERVYPEVLAEILAYTDYLDTHDETADFGPRHEAMATRIEQLTQKDPSTFDLVEWWEGEGAEVLAFRLSLPDPPTLPLSRDDIQEIVDWLKTPKWSEVDLDDALHRLRPHQDSAGHSFATMFVPYLDDYFHQLLRRSCETYDYRLFGSRSQPDGTRTALSALEIVDILAAAHDRDRDSDSDSDQADQ